MKKFLFSSTILLLLLFSTSCGKDSKTQSDVTQSEQNIVTLASHKTETQEVQNIENNQNNNILIVYFKNIHYSLLYLLFLVLYYKM